MASGSSNQIDVPALKTAVYAACLPTAQLDPKHVFDQNHLIALGIVPGNDVEILLAVAQALVNEKLFKVVQSDTMGWRLRSVEDAKKYKSLKLEQEVVYSLIDEAGSDGLWTKTIKARSQLHDALFRAAIKNLESRNLISDMKSVEHPTRKMYIKSTLRPSERATGGPWYTDGELDLVFIEHMKSACEGYIRKRTFYSSSSAPNSQSKKREPKKTKKMTAEEVKASRDKALGPRTKPEGLSEREKRKMDIDRMLPMPAGYKDYPTCDELTAHILSSGISETILTAVDIQQLLDILDYDGRIERILSGDGEWAYRTLRKSLMEEELGTQNLTEAPCGRCPVFDLCEEGGPVGPSNCEYFTDWLAL